MTPGTSDKRVLIITYYWPPDGGPGVQRWLKFVKYLPSFGWTPVVFTPANSTFTITDDSLAKDIPPGTEIVRLPIWEPHTLFFKASAAMGKKKIQQSDFLSGGKKSFFQRISTWVRGNFFIPDARVFWIRPASRFLTEYVQKNNIKIIVTTGPPHSLHLIGYRLKKRLPGLKWVADFRDPWSEWDMLDSLRTSSFALGIHKRMEKKVVAAADEVVTISPYYVKRFEAIGNRPVHLITNGFDESDFQGIIREQNSKFTIRHVGNIDELRDPRPVMQAIRALCISNPDFKENTIIEFVGNVNAAFQEYVLQDPVLSGMTKFIKHLPHSELVQLYGSTDLQLLIMAHLALATGNIPGKVFEYLASGNPILALGATDGDVAHILNESKAGAVFSREDGEQMKVWLTDRFMDWKNKKPSVVRDVNMFSRKRMTEKLSEILNTL